MEKELDSIIKDTGQRSAQAIQNAKDMLRTAISTSPRTEWSPNPRENSTATAYSNTSSNPTAFSPSVASPATALALSAPRNNTPRTAVSSTIRTSLPVTAPSSGSTLQHPRVRSLRNIPTSTCTTKSPAMEPIEIALSPSGRTKWSPPPIKKITPASETRTALSRPSTSVSSTASSSTSQVVPPSNSSETDRSVRTPNTTRNNPPADGIPFPRIRTLTKKPRSLSTPLKAVPESNAAASKQIETSDKTAKVPPAHEKTIGVLHSGTDPGRSASRSRQKKNGGSAKSQKSSKKTKKAMSTKSFKCKGCGLVQEVSPGNEPGTPLDNSTKTARSHKSAKSTANTRTVASHMEKVVQSKTPQSAKTLTPAMNTASSRRNVSNGKQTASRSKSRKAPKLGDSGRTKWPGSSLSSKKMVRKKSAGNCLTSKSQKSMGKQAAQPDSAAGLTTAISPSTPLRKAKDIEVANSNEKGRVVLAACNADGSVNVLISMQIKMVGKGGVETMKIDKIAVGKKNVDGR